MPLDPAAIGRSTARHTFRYGFKDVALYALGVGAKRAELAYVYEGREQQGPRVLPTFAVVPVYAAVDELIDAVGGHRDTIVHLAQTVRLHAPIPAAAELVTVGTVRALYDLKRMGQALFTTRTEHEGQLLFETEWLILYREDGGFGGERPPKSTAPTPPEGEPAFVFEERTSEEQALLYRLCGDLNPLHADPEFAKATGFEQPILHGLCTYGFVARAVVQTVCGGDASKLTAFSAQFRKPVVPGDTLRTELWPLEDGRVAIVAKSLGTGEAVVTQCYAELTR